METKTTITKLTQGDLVDLLCTATYGSNWLECYAPKESREGVDIKEGDCREDVWAKVLLAGKKIECCDHYADEDVYSPLGHIDEDGDAVYEICLDDIIKGLEAAANGTFNGDYKDWARESFDDFIKEDMDLPRAECLMQIILFNEIVY